MFGSVADGPNGEPPTTPASVPPARSGSWGSPLLPPTMRLEPPPLHQSDPTCQLRRVWRLGRSTSTTSTSAPAKNLANPTPHDPVPSTPTRDTSPNDVSHPNRASNPARSAENDSIPNMPPFESIAAATWVSAWVSTPPTTLRTIDITAPFTCFKAKGWQHHRDGGRTQPSWNISSTGAPPPDRCVPHQPHHPSQPVMRFERRPSAPTCLVDGVF